MLKINKTIKALISADFMFVSATGFIDPIFAIFLVDSISGGSAKLVGTAVAIYWITKSIIRIPIAYYIDKRPGEFDDFYVMIAGFTMVAICRFLYLLADSAMHIYIIQILLAVATALAVTPWYGFFSRHIDKYHENLEWSIEVSVIGFGIAGAGFAAGLIADAFGFAPIFVVAGVLSLIATMLLFFIGKNIKIQKKNGFTIKTKT